MHHRPLKWCDPLHWAGVALFLALVVAWAYVRWNKLPDSAAWRSMSRWAGYIALGAMLVPYLHILRRCWRYRTYGRMSLWLRFHIASSYIAFAALLTHSHARTETWFTGLLTALVWIVMVSGIVGYYGQKLLYRMMPFFVRREIGMEWLNPRRDEVQVRATNLIDQLKKMDPGMSAHHQAAFDSLLGFFERSLEGWRWPFTRLARHRQSENLFRRLTELVGSLEMVQNIAALEKLYQERREYDLEYFLHRLGRVWLLFHGPAAAVLLVLMLDHVFMSMWYGGF